MTTSTIDSVLRTSYSRFRFFPVSSQSKRWLVNRFSKAFSEHVRNDPMNPRRTVTFLNRLVDIKKNPTRSTPMIDRYRSFAAGDHLRTNNDVEQIANDIKQWRNQLFHMPSSITIHDFLNKTQACCCQTNKTKHFCQRLIRFENETTRQNMIEYVYKIESRTNKSNMHT